MSKQATNPETEQGKTSSVVKKRKINWGKASIAANIALLVAVILVAAGAVIIHESDTNPEFCGTCHIMQDKVTSYMEGTYLDHIHAESGVMCKDCHSDYTIPDEIQGGIAYITNNYEVDENGALPVRDFGDEICTQCHISRENVERQTDYLYYNPHFTAMGIFTCNTCHPSHAEHIDYCSTCHLNGGQRMIGDTTPRKRTLGEEIRVYN